MASRYRNLITHGGITYNKMNIVQVKNAIKNEGSWSGLLVPNKVNSFHFEGGWYLGHRESFMDIESLENHVHSCLYYMSKELGNRVAFYKIARE